jgi:tripartite-type tricarboxylate transporter receptor subunit TctC
VKAAPDGQTIGVVSNNHVVNPSVFKKMPFDALNDITPISVVGATPVRAGREPRQRAGEEREGAAGLPQGQAGHVQLRIVGQRHHHSPGRRDVRRRAGVDVRHIPYKGVGPMRPT